MSAAGRSSVRSRRFSQSSSDDARTPHPLKVMLVPPSAPRSTAPSDDGKGLSCLRGCYSNGSVLAAMVTTIFPVTCSPVPDRGPPPRVSGHDGDDPPSRRTPSALGGGDGLLRRRAQAKTSAVTTAVTTRPILPSSSVRKGVATSSDPDTISAILPDRCPARAAWTAKISAVAGAATNSRTPSTPTVTRPMPLAPPAPLRNARTIPDTHPAAVNATAIHAQRANASACEANASRRSCRPPDTSPHSHDYALWGARPRGVRIPV